MIIFKKIQANGLNLPTMYKKITLSALPVFHKTIASFPVSHHWGQTQNTRIGGGYNIYTAAGPNAKMALYPAAVFYAIMAI